MSKFEKCKRKLLKWAKESPEGAEPTLGIVLLDDDDESELVLEMTLSSVPGDVSLRVDGDDGALNHRQHEDLMVDKVKVLARFFGWVDLGR